MTRLTHAFAIPAYGRSPYLRECLDSLAAQTVASPVVLCTSTPSEWLDRIADEYRLGPVRVNPVRDGIASDWNFALTATGADVVTVAHQDDVYAPDYGRWIRATFAAFPDALIAFTDHTEHSPRGPRRSNLNLLVKRGLSRLAFGRASVIDDERRKRRLLRFGNPVCCPSVAINRRRLPRFRFDATFQSNLDWEAWSRLAGEAGAFAWVRSPLVSHRVHAGTETSACIADRRRAREDLQMFRRHWGALPARLIHGVYQLSYRSNRV